ncbi:PLP-dependent aminotransferase family protein [Gordonia hongkongensis]|uniref:MocR-like pyridoxine biosynthesis transcription factor PdxR n=1 Tax=Gordonia hongkongensis TaxID=1701090 RepID=UPI003EB82442
MSQSPTSASAQYGPVRAQIFEALRSAILSGQIAPGARLPSTRTLANTYGVSRNTVMSAFDQLRAEGFCEARKGAGTFVTKNFGALAPGIKPPVVDTRTHEPTTNDSGLSRRGRAIAKAPRMPIPPVTGGGNQHALQIGVPALDVFPFQQWNTIRNQGNRHRDWRRLGYNDPRGIYELREQVCRHVAVARGIRCSPEQVVITAGSQQAIDLCCRILLDPGTPAWLEDPGYLGTRAALIASGAYIVPVPVDERGLDVAEGIRRSPQAAAAFVTPSTQFPLTVTMDLDRRIALVNWAHDTGSWIVEDDYDCDFLYKGRQLSALQTLDNGNRVIYIGTFSKTMYPALRLGYIIAPIPLIDALIAAHLATDIHLPITDQYALAEFIRSGKFSRHVVKMRNIYSQRQKHVYSLLDQKPRLRAREMPRGGLHLLGWLPAGSNDEDVAAAAQHAGINTWALSTHCLDNRLPPALLLSFNSPQDLTTKALASIAHLIG